MAVRMQAEDRKRYSTEIAASLCESFRNVADLETISKMVDVELSRYSHVPVKDFVALLVERKVRARLRDLEAHGAAETRGRPEAPPSSGPCSCAPS